MNSAVPDIRAIELRVRPLLDAGRFEEAEAILRPYLAGGSGPLVLWKLLAAALRPQGRIAETRAIQEMIVGVTPGDFPARFDLSETLLLSGEFERGWREYRYRYSLAHTTAIERKVQRPRWDGRAMPGKTLLIHDEQGYGDTFQFMRLVPWAKAKSGARVVLEINAETLSLAQRSAGFDDIVVRGTLPPAFDMHCEMMSLPMALGLKLDDLPGPVPYLSADPQRLAHWRQRLRDLPRPLVALVWAGRPTHFNDANRSLKLAQLAPLAQAGVSFVSIQKGPAAAQADSPPEGMRLLSLSGEIADFDDTAAILSIADLLISVDSSPVHLAGALGRPVWVMLPKVPDWRWLLERTDTPWYPDMRLFRQDVRADWAGVIARMAAELARFTPL
ncbi:glycosyltransferase family 9 protein [Trinickia sp. YCB016]